MAISEVTPPDEEPVSVAELREHLRLESGDSENGLLGGLIASARSKVEAELRRQLITATFDLFLDVFPDRDIGAWGPGHSMPRQDREQGLPLSPETIELPRPPLQSVASVQFLDDDGNTQTVPAADYIVDTVSTPGRIIPAPDQFWPIVASRRPNAVFIRFDAGFGDPADVPKNIKLAIKVLAAHWYENREATTPVRLGPTPMSVAALLDSSRWGDYR